MNPEKSPHTQPDHVPAQTPPAHPAVDAVTPTPLTPPTGPAAPIRRRGLSRLIGAPAAAVLGSVFSWLILPAAIVAFLHFFVFQAFHVVGGSMLPTLQETNYLIISKLPVTISNVEQWFGRSGSYSPSRGQIIVFHYPKDPSLVFVKRVIARAGERVVIKDGHVTVYTADHPQGMNPDTGYEPANTVTLGSIDETVPSGSVFVLGDNRAPDGSFDSRQWGDLPTNDIIGQAVARLLPLNQVRTF